MDYDPPRSRGRGRKRSEPHRLNSDEQVNFKLLERETNLRNRKSNEPEVIVTKIITPSLQRDSEGKTESRRGESSSISSDSNIPIPVLDRWLAFNEKLPAFLSDQPHQSLAVVGVIGKDGVGKSSIMSWIAAKEGMNESDVFHVKTLEDISSLRPITMGVDLCRTPSRLFLLDSFPIHSSLILARLLQSDTPLHAHNTTGYDVSSVENIIDLRSLQLSLWLLCVCQSVIVVDDSQEGDDSLFEFICQCVSLMNAFPSVTSSSVLMPNFSTSDFSMTSQASNHPPNPRIIFVSNFSRDYLESSNPLSDDGIGQFSQIWIDRYQHSGQISQSISQNMGFYSIPDVSMGTLKNLKDLAIQGIRTEIECTREMSVHLSERDWARGALNIWQLLHCSPIIRDHNRCLQQLGYYE